ncbi:MAG: hypothetical protein ACRC7R_10890 [Sarcina sp.]
MKKVKGFISIEVILISSLLILITSFLDEIVYNNRMLLFMESEILSNDLIAYKEENIFLKNAIDKLNEVGELNKENFKMFSYKELNKKLEFSYDEDIFILEEKVPNTLNKRIYYYDYFIKDNEVKLDKRRFYEIR